MIARSKREKKNYLKLNEGKRSMQVMGCGFDDHAWLTKSFSHIKH